MSWQARLLRRCRTCGSGSRRTTGSSTGAAPRRPVRATGRVPRPDDRRRAAAGCRRAPAGRVCARSRGRASARRVRARRARRGACVRRRHARRGQRRGRDVRARGDRARDAERRVADSERRFRAVVDVANEGVWVLDADGSTTFLTERMAAMLGTRRGRRSSAARRSSSSRRVSRRRAGADAAQPVRRQRAGARRVRRAAPARSRRRSPRRRSRMTRGATSARSGSSRTSADAARRERELAESRRLLGAIAEVHDDVLYVGETAGRRHVRASCSRGPATSSCWAGRCRRASRPARPGSTGSTPITGTPTRR